MVLEVCVNVMCSCVVVLYDKMCLRISISRRIQATFIPDLSLVKPVSRSWHLMQSMMTVVDGEIRPHCTVRYLVGRHIERFV